jgi:uncharacterized protein
MKIGEIISDDDKVRQVLRESKTVAVLGLSTNPEKASHRVAGYLQDQGYRIIPIRPGLTEILGEKTRASLDDIESPVDIIDVFRRPEDVLPHAQEALRLKPKVFWMQLNIKNEAAASLLTQAGIDVIMDRCMKVEHEKLLSKDPI